MENVTKQHVRTHAHVLLPTDVGENAVFFSFGGKNRPVCVASKLASLQVMTNNRPAPPAVVMIPIFARGASKNRVI